MPSASAPNASDGTAPSSPSRAAAFGALVSAHCDRLCKYAYRYVRSREIAEDVVQEVFTRLWERGDESVLRDPLPYLYRAVDNRAIRHLRHEQVRRRWRARVALDPPTAEGTHVGVERADLAHALDRAIADLPERRRQAFTMSREQGLPRVLVQAAATGVPSVAFEVEGAYEIVQDGVSGYVVPSKAVERLAERVASLLDDPARARAMGVAARSLVHEGWTIEKMVADIEAVYLDLTIST